MISELTFIRYYNSFWNQILPGIDHYVRLINGGLKERKYAPIVIEDIPTRRALINAVAFKTYHNIIANSRDKSFYENPDYLKLISSLHQSTILDLIGLDNNQNFDNAFTNEEHSAIKNISGRILETYPQNSNLLVYPKFPGCGLLFECSGDILQDTTLVEVKAGVGNFKKQDILQLLVYSALNNISENPLHITHFALFNPRVGSYWRENVETVIEMISGGSSTDLYGDIVGFVSGNERSL